MLAQVPAFGGLIEQYGIEMNMVIADRSPEKDDANDLFIEWYDDEGNLTEDGQEAVAVLGNLVNDAYETFFTVVKDGRTGMDSSITEEDMRAAATGAIFIGEEALDAKLVDQIGYLDEAIAYAASQAGMTGEPKVTVMHEPEGFSVLSLLAERDGVDMTNLTGSDLRDLVNDYGAVRLEYRWASP